MLAATITMLATRGFGEPTEDVRSLDGGGVALAVLASVPLAWTSRRPLAVTACVLSATVALVALSYGLDVTFGALVIAYQLASRDRAPSTDRGARAAQILVAALVPCAALALVARGEDIAALGPELAGWALLIAATWIAGDRSRLRRAHVAQMRERLLRAREALDRERRLAVAEERTRIARELHDSAGHAINVILVQAGAARLLHGRDQARSQEAIATIERVARDTIGEIDQLVRALREAEDPDVPVSADAAALEGLATRRREDELRVALRTGGADRAVARHVAWGAYRILQEALANAARHGTGTADVTLRFERPLLKMRIVNPVAGHVGDGEGRAGHGLIGMSERAAMLGGTLEADREDGVFSVEVRLPYGEGGA